MAERADKAPDILSVVIRDFDDDHTPHQTLVNEYERRYKSYRATREFREYWRDREGTEKPRPAYIFQSVETMVANLIDPSPLWNIRVSPQMADPQRLEELRQGARANEILLQHQLGVDHWAEKQREFDLQGLVMGVTAAKQSWNFREGTRRYLRSEEREVRNIYGGKIGSVPILGEQTEQTVMRDDPTSEVIDVRHLIFQRGKPSLQKSERLSHRCFYSYSQLKQLECSRPLGHDGPCDPGKVYHGVDRLKDAKGVSPEHFDREQEMFGTKPHQDDIELIEQWRIERGVLRTVTVGDRGVVLADRRSPFWLDHLDHPFPFVVCSGTPDLFKINGISEVEVMAELQDMLWMLIQQRLTNLELVNNAILLIADDVIDPDEFEFAPGERWLVPRPVQDTVQMWSPDTKVADLSLQAEALLKGDLQNVTGGMPFLSGTQSGTVDQETATGVSIVTSLAQKRLAAKRQQFIWAKSRIGEQWTALNQQFIREPRMVPVIGLDGVEAFEEIRPEMLEGLFLFETVMAEESMMRQERRAEAQAKFQVAMEAAPAMAMMGTPINAKAFMDDILDAYDIQDKDRYYSAQPQQPQIQPGQEQPAAPGSSEELLNGGGPMETNPELAAGPLAPSNENSLSGGAALQQFMSQRGAVQ